MCIRQTNQRMRALFVITLLLIKIRKFDNFTNNADPTIDFRQSEARNTLLP